MFQLIHLKGSVKTGGEDAFGQPKLNYETVDTFYGMVDLLTKSNEENVYRDLFPDTTHVLITDGMPKVTPTTFMRIEVPSTGNWYDITGVDNVGGQGHHLEIFIKGIEYES